MSFHKFGNAEWIHINEDLNPKTKQDWICKKCKITRKTQKGARRHVEMYPDHKMISADKKYYCYNDYLGSKIIPIQ